MHAQYLNQQRSGLCTPLASIVVEDQREEAAFGRRARNIIVMKRRSKTNNAPPAAFSTRVLQGAGDQYLRGQVPQPNIHMQILSAGRLFPNEPLASADNVGVSLQERHDCLPGPTTMNAATAS